MITLKNDTYGHTVGDEVLQFLSNKLESVAHKKGFVFRYGGEEFTILMRNHSEEEPIYSLKILES